MSLNSNKIVNVGDPTSLRTRRTRGAVRQYGVTGLLEFKGSTDASANPSYPSGSKGDTYVITVAGKIGGASGKSVDVGDMYLATADNAGGTEASVGTSWSASSIRKCCGRSTRQYSAHRTSFSPAPQNRGRRLP